MPPESATKAPKTPTAAYTSALAKRMVGLASDEKNTALKFSSPRAASTSSKRALTASAMPNASTLEIPPIISSVRPVSSPRRRVCPAKWRLAWDEMNLAAQTENGVRMVTTRAMVAFRRNMKARVTTMVRTPVGSCWKPMTRPLVSWSTSVTMRLVRSPCSWESM